MRANGDVYKTLVCVDVEAEYGRAYIETRSTDDRPAFLFRKMQRCIVGEKGLKGIIIIFQSEKRRTCFCKLKMARHVIQP